MDAGSSVTQYRVFSSLKTVVTPTLSATLRTRVHLGIRADQTPQSLLQITIQNRSNRVLAFPVKGAIRIQLQRYRDGAVTGSYSRDASRQVPSLTPPLAHGGIFTFERTGSVWSDQNLGICLSLIEESGGVTTYSRLPKGRYFFTAIYDAGVVNDKRLILHLTGTSFLLP